MARSLSNVKILSDGISSVIFRRGYATGAVQEAAVSRGKTTATAAAMKTRKNTGEQERVGSTQNKSWVPDPKTGFYRPDTGAVDVDPAELRAVLLTNKNN